MKEFDTAPTIDNIINALVENEVILSRLYESFAQQFPLHEAFCQSLAQEEVQHAQWIRALEEKLTAGSVTACPERFSAQVVQFVMDMGKDALAQAQEADMSYERALEIAARVERSMIEKKYFEIFTAQDPELESLMERLAEETLQHAARIEQELAAVRKIGDYADLPDDTKRE